MEPVKFVLVGTGNIAGTYVAATSKVAQAEIVGVVSRDAGRAAEYAAEHSLGESADSLEALETGYDAVMLATPNGLHHRDTLAAAALGKHVLTEKPLDVTLDKMDGMIAACRRAGVRLGVAFQRRMSPANIAMKQLLDSGALGKLYAADLSVKFLRGQDYYDSGAWRGTRAVDGGGPFIQQASHNVDTITWFFGLPARVQAVTGLLAHTGIEVEDHGAAILVWPGGMIGTIVASTVTSPGYPVRLEIHTERGSVLTINDEIERWDVEGVDRPEVRSAEAIHSGAGAGGAAVTDTSGHEAIIADFCEAVRTGRDPAVSGEEARRTGLLIDTIYRAAEARREVEIPQ
ncbi:MAG: Gfo/Idh/MocA family oxidoreductase [Candidatus Glassbacteria bacterium]|nr:Gfo/Idh/MocA family oxidoreductase [Candidatus Glassbacteria bacterium]